MCITRLKPVAVVILAAALFLGSTHWLIYQTLAEDQNPPTDFQKPKRKGLNLDPPHISTDKSVKYDYDIVYVRGTRLGDKTMTVWADVETPTAQTAGADLVVLHPDGSETVLFEGGKGAVTDPAVSFDGEWVYFAYFYDQTKSRSQTTLEGSDLYKVHAKTRKVVQLTHQEFTPNTGAADWSKDFRTPEKGKSHFPKGVFNLGPCPVPGGKVMFTSNRNGYRPPRSHNGSQENLQLFVMDEDGANVELIGYLNLASALHPVVLKDGRVMFSTLESQGIRSSEEWGIWTIHPDGTNWGPLVSAFVGGEATGGLGLVHFQAQLSDESIIWQSYYRGGGVAGLTKAFGTYAKMPVRPPAEVAAFAPANERHAWNQRHNLNMRFSPYGLERLTPFTDDFDEPAPRSTPGDPKSPRVGRFTHPASAPENHLLTAYSPGPAHAMFQPMHDSGIYLIKDGRPITEPAQMLLIKNDPRYNEQMPRALVPYKRIYGVDEPKRLVHVNDGTLSPHLPEGTPFGLIGTSSMYKRETYPNGVVPPGSVTATYAGESDPWKGLRAAANWQTQGAEAGWYTNDDIHAIRILIQEPTSDVGQPRRFLSHAMERMRILGEIPVRKFGKGKPGASTTGGQPLDPDGNPDTSFLAKIPADTAFTFQTLDKHGMVLNMAQTWHQVRPGEVRNDCGGCHAHSQKPTEFKETAAAKPEYVPFDLTKTAPLLTAKKKDESGTKWDSTDQTGLRFEKGVKTVEYYRDVKPILDRSCAACHTQTWDKPAGNLVLDDETKMNVTWAGDRGRVAIVPGSYFRLALDESGNIGQTPRFGHQPWWRGGEPGRKGKGYWDHTRASRYIWKLQSRRSLLVWKIFGQRLDGFSNDMHAFEPEPGSGVLKYKGAVVDPMDPKSKPLLSNADVGYVGSIMPPPEAVAGTYVTPAGKKIKVAPLSDEDRLTLVRWIDLGCPIDLDYDPAHPEARGKGWMLDDNRPTLTLTYPKAGANGPLTRILVGMHDFNTGLDMDSFQVIADFVIDGTAAGENAALKFKAKTPGVWELMLSKPLTELAKGKLTVSVKDRQGNISRIERTFSVAPPAKAP